MISSIFLALALFSLFFISFYLILNIIFYFSPTPKNQTKKDQNKKIEQVDILIPAHNEGEVLVNALEGIRLQDFHGVIHTWILVKDNSDLSYHLVEDFIKKNQNKNRVFHLTDCLVSPKKDKLNLGLTKVKSTYIALLDADHVPKTHWISKSLDIIIEKNADVIQGKRGPLSLSNIFQIWDSIQNHIGNELFNNYLDRLGRKSFFTGTTTVFHRRVFDEVVRFQDSITEDTYLSYEILSLGKNIIHTHETGSDEEVAPNFFSYFARRRRWSNGHNQSFFKFLPNFLKSKISISEKIKNCIHGSFYLIPLFILLFLILKGSFLWLQFNTQTQVLSVLIGLILSYIVYYIFARAYNNFLIDFFITCLLVIPLVFYFTPTALHLMGRESFYYIISFPYYRYLDPYELVLILFPLVFLVIGQIRIPILSAKNIFKAFVSYPLILFIDVYAIVLGIGDFVFKKNVWAKITRSGQVDFKAIQFSWREFFKISGMGILFFVSFILLNDFTAKNNCGEIDPYFLNETIIYKPRNEVDIQTNFKKKIENEKLKLIIENKINSTEDVLMSFFIDGKPIEFKRLSMSKGESIDEFMTDIKFSTSKLTMNMKSNKWSCSRDFIFSNIHKEIIGDQLFLNGEPFLIKGIIPSFQQAKLNLDLKTGLSQIHNTGANTIRFYHQTPDEVNELAQAYSLMMVDQPNESTWDNFNVTNSWERKTFFRRFLKLEKNTQGLSNTLIHNLGNELEIHNTDEVIDGVKVLSEYVVENRKDQLTPVGYSTYFTFMNYPVDILAINMLDSGDTYWNKAMKLVTSYKKPFYASEWGGFVAFYEDTPPVIQSYRIHNYWDILLKNRALGAIFFQSHDNWAQPVPHGANDPFTDEMPDDKRGVWDHGNKAKPQLIDLQEVYSDFEISYDKKSLINDAEIFFKIKNIRPYVLRNIHLYVDDIDMSINLSQLNINQEIEVKLNNLLIQNKNAPHTFRFVYQTHHGLDAVSVNSVFIPYSDRLFPSPLNKGMRMILIQDKEVGYMAIKDGPQQFIMPNGWNVVSGQSFTQNGNKLSFGKISNKILPKELFISRDGKHFSVFNDSDFIDGGMIYLKFKFDHDMAAPDFLFFEGTGSNQVSLSCNGNFINIETHNYRENFVQMSSLPFCKKNDWFVAQIDRQNTRYINHEGTSAKESVWIALGRPYLFSPQKIVFKKKD